MKKLFLLRTGALTLFVFAFLFSGSLVAQDAKPVASPRDSVSGKIGKANVEINYGSPAVKGRKIWGELEKYGKVWRAGANGATTFKTDKDVTVEGKTLPAGTYAFFVIPAESGPWTVIFSKNAKQWGAYKYNESEDALRVSVSPRKVSDLQERLQYAITKKGFELRWEYIQLPVSVK
ncbi:DUF2911 family protein [Arcticibacter tournemirensis]|uniref:DUF2911 domain-containing protein n=1 Tax=Arcticibacter tournemirensis TaxID=699437 RepID=A0A5M9H0C5_9SPHI|nr:DUF2911 domain-containing protein [Arcticibacter tournemirensis]KAA8478518.1 DUF2911 domain-containing protein [Arcticibacter tournemirensis]TQM51135.1 DUF2911 family protein [Arcticibacter tournemirensis]